LIITKKLGEFFLEKGMKKNVASVTVGNVMRNIVFLKRVVGVGHQP
jgi:hypothetical protein